MPMTLELYAKLLTALINTPSNDAKVIAKKWLAIIREEMKTRK